MVQVALRTPLDNWFSSLGQTIWIIGDFLKLNRLFRDVEVETIQNRCEK